MIGIFREIQDFFRYLVMPIESKRVLFYSEHASYTINFRPIMDQLIQKYDLKICYITSDPNDPILETKEKNVTVLYSRILLTFLMGILTDKTVCVMTMSELHNNPVIKRSINDVHYIYVFHAMMSTIMTHKFGGFDHFDTIVCVGQYHVDEIRKTEEVYKVKKRRIVEGGYTRLDDIRRQYCEYLQNAPPKEKYHVLFGPSWGPNSFVEYQTEQAKVMIDSLLANNFFVTIRYHPETVRRRDDVIKFFDDHYEQNINVKIEKSVANNESILKADTIITDWSGIALEYAFGTERPVISIDVPPKHQNDRYGELGLLPFEMQVRDKIGIIVPPENLEGIGERVKEIMNTKDAWRDKIIETRNKNIFYLDQAAEKTAEAITGIANEQRKKK